MTRRTTSALAGKSRITAIAPNQLPPSATNPHAKLVDGDFFRSLLELMKAKGMDLRDGTLAQAIGHRLIHSLRMQEKRKRVCRDGKRHGVSPTFLVGNEIFFGKDRLCDVE